MASPEHSLPVAQEMLSISTVLTSLMASSTNTHTVNTPQIQGCKVNALPNLNLAFLSRGRCWKEMWALYGKKKNTGTDKWADMLQLVMRCLKYSTVTETTIKSRYKTETSQDKSGMTWFFFSNREMLNCWLASPHKDVYHQWGDIYEGLWGPIF